MAGAGLLAMLLVLLLVRTGYTEYHAESEILATSDSALKCTDSCCVRLGSLPPFHAGTPDDPYTATDRLAPITVKRIAELHYGSLIQPVGTNLPKLTQSIIPCLQNGTSIFVDSPDLADFLTTMLPRFTTTFVLITGDSDTAIPGSLPSKLVQRALDSTLILHCQWHHSLESLHTAIDLGYDKRPKVNYYSVLVSFAISSNVTERKPVWDALCNTQAQPQFARCYMKPGVKPVKFYRLMAQSKFVISPPGAGLDCYRTYEALYLGSYPIVKSSSLDELFEDLPVLIVNDLTTINDALLKEAEARFQRLALDGAFRFEKLYAYYWMHQFLDYRPRIQARFIYSQRKRAWVVKPTLIDRTRDIADMDLDVASAR
eukprot:jgi/Hompol1/1773/HPOL_005713-RA